MPDTNIVATLYQILLAQGGNMPINETDRARLLACRTEEEWQWWIEGEMLQDDSEYPYRNDGCLFCTTIDGNYPFVGCRDCISVSNPSLYPPCSVITGIYRSLSERNFAGWDRLKAAGIV